MARRQRAGRSDRPGALSSIQHTPESDHLERPDDVQLCVVHRERSSPASSHTVTTTIERAFVIADLAGYTA
jgi:hypothetical protein